MLTSYMVKCPHVGCDWFGSLLPRRNLDAWSAALPRTSVVTFECPQCGETWDARVVGDDVVRLEPETAGV